MNNKFKFSVYSLFLMVTLIMFTYCQGKQSVRNIKRNVYNTVMIGSSSISQNNTQSYIKVNKLSFFNKSLPSILQNNLTTFQSKLNSDNIITYDNLSDDYFEINDQWTYIKRYDNLIINLNNRTPAIYKSRLVPQLLNDTLLLAFDGKIINLNSGETLYDNVGPWYLPIEIKKPKQIKSIGKVLKTDILFADIEDVTSNFIYNILSNGLFIHKESNAFRGNILNNPKSKYIMYTENYTGKNASNWIFNSRFCLMNRFNVNDTVDIPRFLVDGFKMGERPPVIYNDSIVYYAVSINKSPKLLNYNYNKELNIELSEETLGSSDFKYFYQKLLRGSYDTEEARKGVQTCYFHKKYNNIDISEKQLEEFTNYFNTYKNLLDYNPFLIIEYNFITKRIKSILDKAILPFNRITSLYLDNNNRFLIAQQNNEQFTIFNLKTKKEIITLNGFINDINSKNELIINVLGIRQNSNSTNPSSIELIKLDLNELLKIRDDSYIHEISSPLNFDEFTTINQFNSKIQELMKSQISILISTKDSNLLNSAQHTVDNYSNKYIKWFLGKTINNYYNVLNSGNAKEEQVYTIKYYSYSIDSKILEFVTEELTDKRQDLLSNFDIDNFQISDQRYAGKNYSIIRLKNVSSEEAKKFKDSNCAIIVKKSNNFEIPNIDNLFVFRHFDVIKNNFYYKNDPEIEQSKKFYNFYVPINSEIPNFYNSWYLRINNEDKLLYRKK